mmetsp:Transcript_13369/g.53978  ORF Transcript_13369/g.53978 Transcript_13369/m.53978 type:complete len:168 (-) Transcript_13369:1092-1595(-)
MFVEVCSALGADLYDCVYPSRTARFGTALVPEGTLRLKTAAMAADYRPIDDACDCLVCQKYSRAHLHAKITKVTLKSETILGSIVDAFFLQHHSQLKTRHHILQEPHAASLLTYHNMRYQMRLCKVLGIHSEGDNFTTVPRVCSEFCSQAVSKQHGSGMAARGAFIS